MMITEILIHKPILKDFFKYLFPEANGIYQITSKFDIGKYLISRVMYSDTPVKSVGENRTKIKLPKTHYTTGCNKYCYYSREDIEKINYELEAAFSIDFDRYYLQGLKLKMKQKEIIAAYILSRNLISLNGDIETLKKRVYREEVKKLDKLTQFFKNRAHHRHHIIEDSLSSYITV